MDDPGAKDFLTYDYAELKDLAKAFLTLISGTLVVSLTFSEKIINVGTAGPQSKGLLQWSWVCFAAAILLCGLALCANYQALVNATHGAPGRIDSGLWDFVLLNMGFWDLSNYAGRLMFFSGSVFVVGIILLLSSSIKSMRDQAKSMAARPSLMD